MSIIEYSEGCGNNSLCMGPTDPYYTLFNTPDFYLHVPAGYALLGALGMLLVLYILRRFGRIGWSNLTMVILALVAFLLLFSWLASITRIVY